MNDVASLELSKELYELSGWDDTYCKWNNFYYTDGRGNRRLDRWRIKHSRTTTDGKLIVPAYSLGYLLRKLPDQLGNWEHNFVYRLSMKKIDHSYFFEYSNHAWWRDNKAKFTRAGYDTSSDNLAYGIKPVTADTPEDAACKLAIELFKQGVLKKEVA
jgi:hypothetical protein